MTIQELIGEYDFTSNVRNELYIAYDESPQGFERVCRKAEKLKNPPGAITSMIRSGQHLKDDRGTDSSSSKPPHDTLEEVVDIALRAFNARKKKYGTDDYYYAAWVATSWNGRFSDDTIAAALRERLRFEPADDAPAPCPPELLERMLRQAGRIGAMPNETPEPKLKVDADELAHRLLAVKPDVVPAPNPQTLAERLLATLGG